MGFMSTISKKLYQAVKLSSTPAYKLAHWAQLHPNTLSKILHGAIPLKTGDKRVCRIGKILGLKPEELFESKEH